MAIMCGRVIQSSGPLRYAIVDGMNARDSRVHNYPPRWNAAPGQDLLVIRRNHQTGELSLDPLRWGLIPYWCQDPKGGRKPINAKCETVHTLPTFRDAYRRRRCIVPVDGFFEWKAIKGQKAKQPYAIAMKDGSPFGIGGLWENWKEQNFQSVRAFRAETTRNFGYYTPLMHFILMRSKKQSHVRASARTPRHSGATGCVPCAQLPRNRLAPLARGVVLRKLTTARGAICRRFPC